jgi:3-oxoacyl-[acyl-carrier protein] reductase
MELGLSGRVALVTGASRGIGRAIADALEAEGARVARASRSSPYAFDSGDLEAIDPLVDAIEADLGPIDVYVANTGGPPRSDDPLAFSAQQWETAHRTLVVSPMLIMRRVVPGMRERGFGRVLAVSSSSAREPLAGLQLSNANRPGLLAAMKLLARESAADGVTFNAVLPGRIATDRLAEGYGGLELAEAAARDEVPAARLGRPEEVAAAAVFMCSAAASYVTGQSLLVDGGLTRSW